jgi:hypothetical protein
MSNLVALAQYVVFAAMIVVGGGLVLSLFRALTRVFGWDVVLGIRKLGPRTDYPPDWDRVRRVVLQRDGYKCKNCSSQDQLHVHHIVPLSSGGTNNWSNLVTLCRKCHRRLHPHMR